MRNWLVKLREDKSLTQQQVADVIGITRQLISAIENGKANPSVQVAKAIGEMFNFPWVDFFDKEMQK